MGGCSVIRRCLLGGLLSFFLAIPAVAASISTELKEGEGLFAEALQGDKRAHRKAQKKFRAAERKHPGHPLVNAYLGALIALQGREALRPEEKRRLNDQALVKLDAALDAITKHRNDVVVVLKTKLVIAQTQVNLPPFFNRLVEGRKLVEELMADEFFSVMPARFQAAAYATAARYAEKQGHDEDYERYLSQVMGSAPASQDAEQARRLLKRLGGL